MAAPSGGGRTIVRAEDINEIARGAAELFVRVAGNSTRARGRVDVALSGGSTPRALHGLLASAPYRERVEWQRVQFYWGDERCVPPDSAESNYRMGRETLLSLLPIQPEQVHRMRGELPPDEAAAQYERELRESMGLASGQLPRFDLIFLGMGPDGHTLSLFPQTAALHVTDRSVTANYVPKLDTHRITLTYPTANNAAHVAFLVAGADKAEALAAVLAGPRDTETYPSRLISPTDGELFWFVDRAAAANLRTDPGTANS
jgi:6-phosphogluconolactonase